MNSWQLQQPGRGDQQDGLESRAAAGDTEAAYQLARRFDQAGHKDEALGWMQKAAAGGLAKAKAQQGVWELLGHNTDRDNTAGFGHVLEAAEAGHLGGQRVIATLYAAGLGCAPDWQEARKWLIAGARAGDKAALRQIGYLLMQEAESFAPGRPLLTKAAADGDLIAQYLLGKALWESGRLNDRKEAKNWIAAAAGWGHRPASDLFIQIGAPNIRPELPPSAQNPQIDWAAVEDRFRLPVGIDSPAVERLKDGPRVDVARGLLDPWLCDYMMAAADPRLKPANIIDESQGEMTDAERRSNSAMAFWVLENDVIVESVNAAIATTMGFPRENGETMSVLHYKPGETYSTHYDYCDPDSPAHAREMAQKGQRVETVLVYLNDGYEGGETRFDSIDWSFKGAAGDAMRFFNVTEDGDPDRRTAHTGLPPTRGDKWIISKWVRDKAQY